METGKTGKYFKYAIGEIILVVIGILIALSINNWNEQRKNRIKETTILKQIHKDFKRNKIQLDSIKSNNEEVLIGCDAILRLMPFKSEKQIIDSIIKYSTQILSVKTFNPSNGAIEALINSSSFEVIQNDTLRNLLVSWKDVYHDYSEEEQFARDFQIWQLMPYFRKNINFMNPYTDSNLEKLITSEFHNMWIDKKQSVLEVVNAIKDEQVEHYINEIIRLTQNH